MTRGVQAAPFILKNDDEIFLSKIPNQALVEALREVHPPSPNNYEQAAANLNIPIGTLKSRVSRARSAVVRMRQNAAEGRTDVA